MHPFFFTVVGAIFILSLVILQLSLYGGGKKYLNFLLGIAIFGIAWYALIYLMTNSGYIKNYPLLFNKGLPLYYAIAPCLFIYVRGSLNSAHSKFKKTHLLHFLIIIPALISVLPYNLLDYSSQLEVVRKVAADVKFAFSEHKYIVEPWHWFTFPISAIVYTGLQLKLARLASAKKSNSKIVNWVYLFSGICLILFSGMLVVNVLILKNLNKVWFILHQSNIILLLCCCLLLLSVTFFINPELIFGLRKNEPLAVVENPSVNEDRPNVHSIEKTRSKTVDDKLIQQVESFINETQIFRKNGLTLSELASQLDVPTHKLSDLFNNHYQLNFNTYINNLRIIYIKERLDSGLWKQLTLEAIAIDAGFSSRNTFFVAFKKSTGKTPSTYLQDLKKN